MILDPIIHVLSSLLKEFKDIPGCNQCYRCVTELLADYKLVKEHGLILRNSKFTYMKFTYMSLQANWEQVVKLVRYKLVKG